MMASVMLETTCPTKIKLMLILIMLAMITITILMMLKAISSQLSDSVIPLATFATTVRTTDYEDHADVDSDTVGDACDNFPSEGSPDQADGRQIDITHRSTTFGVLHGTPLKNRRHMYSNSKESHGHENVYL